MKWSLAFAALLVAAATTVDGSSIEYVDAGGSRVAAEALGYLGVPYRFAGVDSTGVDCSGLVWAVYRSAAGEDLPRTVTALIGRGQPVAGRVAAGDLLFFDTTGGPSHVAIAIDERKFVHAASEGPTTGVIVSSIDEAYYRDRFLEARRVTAPGAGRFLMRIDGQPVRAQLAAPVAAGSPLQFAVVAGGSAPGEAAPDAAAAERTFVTFRAMLDGDEMLARRLRVAADAEVSVWLVPRPGRWVVSVEAGGNVLAELAFAAGGRQ